MNKTVALCQRHYLWENNVYRKLKQNFQVIWEFVLERSKLEWLIMDSATLQPIRLIIKAANKQHCTIGEFDFGLQLMGKIILRLK
jgi:hypothetical protein